MEDETARVRITIPSDLVASVDELVGKPNRGAFIVQAVAVKMERERLGRAPEGAAESLPDDSNPAWDAPKSHRPEGAPSRAIALAATERKLSAPVTP